MLIELIDDRVAVYTAEITRLTAEVADLKRELAAARENTERLKWLDSHAACDLMLKMIDEEFDGLVVEFEWPDSMTLGEAIDAARAAGEGEG